MTAGVRGAAEGVRLGLGGAPKENTKTVATSTTSKPGTIPTSDMVYRFGWMEDACTGDQLDFKLLKGQSLSESIKGSKNYTYFIKPKSQWSQEHRDIIKDVKMVEGSEYIEYYVDFIDGIKYRNQPLDRYIFKFRAESSGGEDVLKFASNADVAAIWPNFTTRTMEYWGEMADRGAVYSTQKNTITCHYD
ncbi:hypothetical protein ACTXPO_00265 [Psychrobacter celer]|uniref:hypothetical protein n=1 Tax=Psychrobacter celer TaxID=306572 RepID=UPI003FD64222